MLGFQELLNKGTWYYIVKEVLGIVSAQFRHLMHLWCINKSLATGLLFIKKEFIIMKIEEHTKNCANYNPN